MNIDFARLCGKHSAIYEAYYKQMDSKGTGTIEAMAAAKFLKRSGLSDVVLSRIWDLSDPNGKGYLDKQGFFVALKLVSLAQAGHVYNMYNIYTDLEKPPKVGDLPKVTKPKPQSVTGNWSISTIDRLKYEQLFDSLKPINGMLAGNKVKGVLMDSKLPLETLGKIWDLSDQDKDGNLDKEEFIVAMHLVYQTLEKRTVPDVLPPELRKSDTSGGGVPPRPVPPTIESAAPRDLTDGDFVANFPKDIPPPPVVQLPVVKPLMTRVPPLGGPSITTTSIASDPLIPIEAPISSTADVEWEVSHADLKRYEVMFRDTDRDKDGLVSGIEVKNIFLQSGVPQKILAHIWALCDTNQSGKLNLEQFALAMWFVERKQRGIDPPQVLTASMVPPSMRGIVSGVDLQPQETNPTYTNSELAMIVKEIDELVKERRVLETETTQKEADIRIKYGEVRSLQSELDTLSATLKQLENQRGEAQKRLSDLKAQVNKIREQCQKQEETITEQEEELKTKRLEIQKLKDEENSLQKEYDKNNRELQKLSNHLQNTQLQISSIRSKITELLETQRQMTDAYLLCKEAVETVNTDQVSEYILKIEPDFQDARNILEKEVEEIKPDYLNEMNNSTMSTVGFDADPFGDKTNQSGRNGFDDSFNTISGFDAFNSSEQFGNQVKDPFIDNSTPTIKNAVNSSEEAADRFENDPFAALHAPTGQGQVLSPNIQAKSGPPPRPESPSPALPPKKSKQPPPRPAPPRPLQASTRPEGDVISSSNTSAGFADFADFQKAPTPTPLSSLYNLKARNTSSTIINDKVMTPSELINDEEQSTSHLSNSCTYSDMNANIFTFSSIGTKSSNIPNLITSNSTVLNGPIDFKDDPFKDYRYEDPFNIKDPFDDEEKCPADPEQIFKSDISYIEVKKFSSENGNANNEFCENHDMQEKMLTLVLNPDRKNGDAIKGNISNSITDFDAFSIKSTLTKDSKNNGSNDSLFKTDNSFFSYDKTNSENNIISCSPDAFTDVTKLDQQTSKTEDHFGNIVRSNFNENCFEDDFLQISVDEYTNKTNSNAIEFNLGDSNNNKNSINDSHDKEINKKQYIDDLNSHNDISSCLMVFTKNEIAPKKILNSYKTSNNLEELNSDIPKLAKKFANDYSKPGTFEKDLQEAIKRSMFDQ